MHMITANDLKVKGVPVLDEALSAHREAIITVRGQARYVVLSMETYDRLRELELDPFHPSLRLHKLEGRMSQLHSISINLSYRVVIHFLIADDEIVPVDIGDHDRVYR